MSSRRPEVFISATSADLRSSRQVIKEALLTLGCVPIEQTNFAPDYRSVREMLRARLIACDAVIHLAGNYYGAEPQERAPGEPRRSYTQMEYDVARELKKPIYVFVCGDDFTYDPHTPEPDDKRVLQQNHRAALRSTDHLFYQIADRTDLTLKIHELQTRVDHLARDLKKSRSHLARGITIGIVSLVALSAGLWWIGQRTSKTEQTVARLETALDQQRRYIKTVADAFTAQKAELDRLLIPEAEQFTRAVARVAEQNGLPPAELQSSIDLFVAATKADPKADFMDKALAEFAQKNFASAAQNASQAATAAEAQLQALSKLETRLAAERSETSARLRQARHIEGQSLYSNRDYAGAVSSFRSALAVTTRTAQPGEWAQFQFGLGLALYKWADQAEGTIIDERRDLAVEAFEAALQERTRETHPVEWAATGHHLGVTLRAQASAASGPDRARLLDRAESHYRDALLVRTREAIPLDWADTMNALAIVLRNKTAALADSRKPQLLAETIAIYRSILETRTRDASPREWAETQNNLAIALRAQAQGTASPARGQLLAEAASAYRFALEIRTRETQPRAWARTHHNLAYVLRDQAAVAPVPERTRFLDQSRVACVDALAVRTRETSPREWAASCVNLAASSRALAAESAPDDRARFHQESAQAIADAFSVLTRESLPSTWAEAKYYHAALLLDQAGPIPDPALDPFAGQAILACREALSIHTSENMPVEWAHTRELLARAIHRQSLAASADARTALVAEAAATLREALETITPATDPEFHQAGQVWLAALASTPASSASR